MSEQTAGTAVIRLKYVIDPASKYPGQGIPVGTGGGGGGGAPTTAPTGPAVPGMSPGASVAGRSGGLLGGGLLSRALLPALGIAASPLGAPIMDAVSGFTGRMANAGRDISESLGLAAYARGVEVPRRAAQSTVDQLGLAGKYASDDQIRGIQAMNVMMEQMRADAENRVRGVVSQDRITSFIEDAQAFFKSVLGFLNRFGASGPTSASPGIK